MWNSGRVGAFGDTVGIAAGGSGVRIEEGVNGNYVGM